jgi:DNA gyrase inhibitor GyrI
MVDNHFMEKSPAFLHIEFVELAPVRVIHHYYFFRTETANPDKTIRPAFKELKRRVSEFDLDTNTLLHIGIPELADRRLMAYDCCIEFPLPENIEEVKVLPGGRYAVLTVEKQREKIGPAIRAFTGDYLPEHELVVDEERPTYEIYYKETMEYCVPIH